MSVANAKGHGLDTRTDFATTAADPQLSWRGLRVQATAHRSDAPPGARQSHPRGARPRLAADVSPAAHPRPGRRRAATASAPEELRCVAVALYRPARPSGVPHALRAASPPGCVSHR